MLPRGGGWWGHAAPICFALGSGWRRTPRMSLLGECLCTAGGQGGAAHVNLRRVAEPPDPAIFIVRRNSLLGWREPLPSALAEELAARGRRGGTEMLWARGSPRVLGPGNLVVAVPGTVSKPSPPSTEPTQGCRDRGQKTDTQSAKTTPPRPPSLGQSLVVAGTGSSCWDCAARWLWLSAPPHTPAHSGVPARVQLLAYEQTSPLRGDPTGFGGLRVPPATCVSPPGRPGTRAANEEQTS